MSKLFDVDPNKITCSVWTQKLHDVVHNYPPRSKFVTAGAPGSSGFMWVAFFPMGKFPAILGVAEKHNMRS